jgi:hypothetical protein
LKIRRAFDIIIGMKNYSQTFNDATKKFMQRAYEIERIAETKIDMQYKLTDVVWTLRNLYRDNLFRDKFVGVNQFVNPPWAKGMCALSAKAIYDLIPGLFEIHAIRIHEWEHGPVVFLRDVFVGLPMDPTSDQFGELIVPYELGSPINRPLRTPNNAEFTKRVKYELDAR